MKLSSISTCDLVNELSKREGVKHYIIPSPDYSYTLYISNNKKYAKLPIMDDGPAQIMVVID